jgi:hypothetical protein
MFDRVWREIPFRKRLIAEPRTVLQELGIEIPHDVAVKTIASKGAPSDPDNPSLLQFVLERGNHLAYFFLPSPQSPSAQQAAYGRILGKSPDDPAFDARLRSDAEAAIRRLTGGGAN